MLEDAPRFDTTDTARIARELYGLDGVVRPLTSERDQNFLLEGERACAVLKIANQRKSATQIPG